MKEHFATLLTLLIVAAILVACSAPTEEPIPDKQPDAPSSPASDGNSAIVHEPAPDVADGDVIHFPCPNFEDVVRTEIQKLAGPITKADVADVRYLWASGGDISDFSGIEHLTALEQLNISDNAVTKLDLSKNVALTHLEASHTQLTALDLSKNVALTHLEASFTQLTALDLGENVALIGLNVYENQLTELDLSNNTALEWLEVSNNQLTRLDLSNNAALTYLVVNDNNLTALDVSSNTVLEWLECRSNSFPDKAAIIGLDVSRTSIAFLPQNSNWDTAAQWALEEIRGAQMMGFVPEDIQDNFSRAITRQEFCRVAVTYVAYMLDIGSLDYTLEERGLSRDPNAFSDTTDPDILAAFALGITSGTRAPTETQPGIFTPDGQFTRQEAATMLMQISGILGIDTDDPPPADFVDMNNAGEWARDGINFVRANGIMGGTSAAAPTFSPTGTFSIQESIVTFYRIGQVAQ